jgi:transcriptional regulator NrdR family protein
LEEFDQNWTQFEEIYVTELMVIEKDARRYIFNAIELEKELISIEIRQKMKGKILINSEEYNQLRNNICKVIC